MPRRPIGPWIALTLLLVALGLTRPLPLAADPAAPEIEAQAEPSRVQTGDEFTYVVTLSNAAAARLDDVTVAYALPSGVEYVAGSAELRSNHVSHGQVDPTQSGGALHWSGLAVPAARQAGFYGMHTFLQDRCESGYIAYQLDRVRELMGPGAYVKQLFYRIDVHTPGPEACWVEFVNACYDRDLIPIVRLQGSFGGPNWIKPPADGFGNYDRIAQAYARVVAGLPRREGRPLYVEIWNEPNLDIEWSGEANPVEYAHFLVDVAAAIRALGDPRVVILNGALSPGGNYYSLSYIDAMASVPGAMQAFDVWASHPYPGNHPPEYNVHDDTAPLYAELTIDGYLLELERLAAHGRRDVRVLLTETGYALGQNNFVFQGYAPIDETNRADYMQRAFRDYWSRWPEVLGVCPYELVDPHGNWAVWDWLYPNGSRHLQYDAVAALDKTPSTAPGTLTLRFRARAPEAPGQYAGRVTVTNSGAPLATLDDAAPLQVDPRPPTATPTPSPTPTRTPTPPGPLVCAEALANGGFEDDAGWDLPDTSYPAAYDDAVVRSGAQALRVGIVDDAPVYSYSAARQTFQVPADAYSTRLSFWYYPLSQAPEYGQQYALLLDADKNYLETILWAAEDDPQWHEARYDIVGHAGETLWVQFGVRNDGEGGATAMYVDDVALTICQPESTPAPTPSPTPSSTPSSTAPAVPTASLTPTPPACQEVAANGDFEGEAAWTINDTTHPARYTAETVRSGAQAMALGIMDPAEDTYSYSSVEQTFDLPLADDLWLSFWYYALSDDDGTDRQYLLLLDKESHFTTLMWVHSDARQWLLREIDLSAYAGERVTLRFGVYNDGADGATGMYLDDLSLLACSGAAEPTPTPTRRATATGTAGSWLPLIWRHGQGPAPAGSHSTGQAAFRPALPPEPDGERLSRLPVGLGGDEARAPVRALAVDGRRRRVIVARDREVTVLDSVTGRPLRHYRLPAPVADVAVDAASGRILAAVDAPGAVHALHPDGTVAPFVTGLGRPSRMLIGEAYVYITDVHSQQLVIVKRADGSIIETWGFDAAPHALALDRQRDRLYVGLMGSGKILTLQAETGRILGETQLEGLGYPQALALDEAGKTLYVAHALSPRYGAVSMIDTETLQVERTRFGTQSGPRSPGEPLFGADGLILDERHGALLVTMQRGVAVLDSADLALQMVHPLERSPWPGAIARDDRAGASGGARALYLGDARGELWRWTGSPHIRLLGHAPKGETP